MLCAEMIELAFLLEMDDGGVAVVIPDAELLADRHTVDLFHERLVRRRVKIQAADEVFAVDRMGVGLHDGAEPVSDREQVGRADLMLDLMSELHGFTSFRFWYEMALADSV